MEGWREADGFQVSSGVLGVAIGPVLLFRGAPAGWTFLLMAAAAVLLLAQWAAFHDITFEITSPSQVGFALLGVLAVGLAVVYLTRAANDLPRVFPFHDGDSENFQILPGITTLAVGVCALGRAVASTRPSRMYATHEYIA